MADTEAKQGVIRDILNILLGPQRGVYIISSIVVGLYLLASGATGKTLLLTTPLEIDGIGRILSIFIGFLLFLAGVRSLSPRRAAEVAKSDSIDRALYPMYPDSATVESILRTSLSLLIKRQLTYLIQRSRSVTVVDIYKEFYSSGIITSEDYNEILKAVDNAKDAGKTVS